MSNKINTTSIHSQGKNIPHLRFPEFVDAGEWEERKIGNISRINPSSSIPFQNKFIYIDLESVQSGFLTQEKIISIDDAPSRAQRILQEGDLIFQLVRPYQRNNLLLKKINKKYQYVASTGYAQIRANESNGYIYQYIHTDIFVNNVLEKCTGSSYPAINSNELAGITIPLPTLPEQQKIADCLSSLDDLIATEDKKLEHLKAHKKGLMQKLFPAEGEAVPALRFSEFAGAGEWEEKKIGDICESFSGGTPSTTNKKFYNGKIPFIRSAEIDKDKTELFLSQEGFIKSSAKMIKKGDVLIALYGANSGEVAISKIDGAINQAIICLTNFECNTFVYQFLLLRQEIIVSKYLQGGQGNLSGEIIKSISFSFPTLPEQQKIADCLSSLDELIAIQIKRIELLKQHKKGMMQQLFPVIES